MRKSYGLVLMALVGAPALAAESAPTPQPSPSAAAPTPEAAPAAAPAAGASPAPIATNAAAPYHYPAPATTKGDDQTWYTFNGDLGAQKFATSSQITPANVAKLTMAWQMHTGDVSQGKTVGEGAASQQKIPPTVWSATPLFVNNSLYVSTPFYRILAVEPDTGKLKWAFDPHAVLKALTQPDLKTRGVAYWQAPSPAAGKACQKIVYVGTMEGKIWAADADTGKVCEGFGKDGAVDVNQWNTVNNVFPMSQLQPPTVYKNMLFVGWGGKDWAFAKTPPGIVFALDAETGKLKWQFNPLTPDQQKRTGKINVWESMSVDADHGLLYFATSPPSPDDYGGDRKDHYPYANAVVALDADTGKVVWSRQLVHHELWDYDINAAPTLLDIKKDGKTIPALVETTKQGFLFVLNRLTGEPIYPLNETKVPQTDVPGEATAPTQPEPTIPPPTVAQKWPGVYWLADWLSGGWCGSQAKKYRDEGIYTPPSLKGTIVYPPSTGGVEWGGGALDPRTNTFVVNSSSVAFIYRLIPRKNYDEEAKKDAADTYPQTGVPYGVQITMFSNWLGMPCWKPPYGTLSAYDLNTGKLLWKNPFGEIQKHGFYMPYKWGSVTIGAPAITSTGLIFIGASMDSRVRALDLLTGKELWRWRVDAPTVSLPAIYTYKGREYVAFASGGNSILSPTVSDQLVAFALPK